MAALTIGAEDNMDSMSVVLGNINEINSGDRQNGLDRKKEVRECKVASFMWEI